MDPASIVEDTERTQFCPQMDGGTDGQGETSIPPFQLRWSVGYDNMIMLFIHNYPITQSQIEVPLIQLQCKPDISRSCISRNWIYRGHMDPIFLPTDFANFADVVPKSAIFSRNRGNSLHSIRGRQFFAKSAHRDSLCSCSLETIFREINSSLPVNAGWNTCCAMGSHARRSIDTSIVSQSRVQLIQCQCKSRLQTANLGINNAFNQIAVWPRCLHPPFCPSLRQFRSKSSVRDW